MSQRKILNKLAEEEINIEKRKAKIAFDGKQFLVRIPTEIASIKGIKKGDLFEFTMEIPKEPTPITEGNLKIEYVRKNAQS